MPSCESTPIPGLLAPNLRNVWPLSHLYFFLHDNISEENAWAIEAHGLCSPVIIVGDIWTGESLGGSESEGERTRTSGRREEGIEEDSGEYSASGLRESKQGQTV